MRHPVLVRLLIVFTVVPLVELFLLVRIGQLIGLGATVAVVVTTGVVGAWLTRIEGLRVIRQVREELGHGRVPTDRVLDGLLILLAGAVLLTPGLITDAMGFFLLVPPGRRLVRRYLTRVIARRLGGQRPAVIDAQWRPED